MLADGYATMNRRRCCWEALLINRFFQPANLSFGTKGGKRGPTGVDAQKLGKFESQVQVTDTMKLIDDVVPLIDRLQIRAEPRFEAVRQLVDPVSGTRFCRQYSTVQISRPVHSASSTRAVIRCSMDFTRLEQVAVC